MVKYLVENCGADINKEDKNGKTALSIAAGCGEQDMVKYLV
jgi:ankyrin repeat protein